MREPVLLPDGAAVVIDYLSAQLDVPVVDKVPRDRPATFVLVRRIGGTAPTIVSDSPTFTIEAWAPTDEQAQNLLQLARSHLAVMAGMVGDVAVYRTTEIGGPVNLPDPMSNQPRYTYTIAVHLRGSKLPSSI